MYTAAFGGSTGRKRKKRSDSWLKNRYDKPPFGLGCCGDLFGEFYWSLRRFQFWLCYEDNDVDVDELDLQTARYKPESLATLCDATLFTKKELQLMYRGFKQGCPTGLVGLNKFKEIYAQFFPQGSSGRYAEFVFNTFDQDGSGQISFDEFVIGLSVISRGSLDDKLEWVFSLYDIHHRYSIDRDEMYIVLSSIYDLLGQQVDPPVDSCCVNDHVNAIFNELDPYCTGCITKERFMEMCKCNPTVLQSLGLFDTIFQSQVTSSTSQQLS